jgi:hypothetical protein
VRGLIAAVMARRIRKGSLTESRALELAKMMLYDNPKSLYRLEGESPGTLVYA